MSLMINTRCLLQPITGVQRYLSEILPYIHKTIPETIEVCPSQALGHSHLGHIWEQTTLPIKSRNALLFSPSHTGPLRKTRQIVTIHDMSTFDCPQFFSPQFRNWYQYSLRKLSSSCEKVIVVSEFTKNRLQDLLSIDSNRIEVIYNGVSEKFIQTEIDNKYDLSNLGIPSNSRYLFTVGSIEPRKNLGLLARAWKNIRHKLPDNTYLVISGQKGANAIFNDATASEDLKVLMSDDRVIWTGRVTDEVLLRLYDCAHAFVCVSEYEGFGLPVLEAMSRGIQPVISGAPALLEASGGLGLVCQNQESLGVTLLSKLSSDLIPSASEALRKHATQYTWERAGNITANLLKNHL